MILNIPSGSFAGYIFDLDGTLIDTMPLHYRAWDAAMQKAGLKETLDEDFFYAQGGVPTVKVAEIFGRHYGLPLDPEKVMHEKEVLYLQLAAHAKLIEPVVAFARSIARTHPRAIVTGGPPHVVVTTLKGAGLHTLFDIIVTPADVPEGRGKPAPDMFLLAAKKMGVPPKRVLVFEDAEPGIKGALAADMRVVHVPSRARRAVEEERTKV